MIGRPEPFINIENRRGSHSTLFKQSLGFSYHAILMTDKPEVTDAILMMNKLGVIDAILIMDMDKLGVTDAILMMDKPKVTDAILVMEKLGVTDSI